MVSASGKATWSPVQTPSPSEMMKFNTSDAFEERNDSVNNVSLSPIPLQDDCTIQVGLLDHDAAGLLCGVVSSPPVDHSWIQSCPWISILQGEESVSGATAQAHTQRLLLYLIMMLPSVVVALAMFVAQSIWAAMLLFHVVCCSLLPCLYLRTFYGPTAIWDVLGSAVAARWHWQLAVGAIYFTVSAGGGIGFYHLLGSDVLPDLKEAVDGRGLGRDPASLAAFGCYFCTVNPLLEELFWRKFLYFAFAALDLPSAPHAPLTNIPAAAGGGCGVTPAGEEDMVAGAEGAGVAAAAAAAARLPGPRRRWECAGYYAMYHVFVLAALGLEWWLVALAFLALVIGGQVFGLLAGATGVLSAALAHSGADAAIVWALVDRVMIPLE